MERERLDTRAWWRRPTSLATSSWVSSGGARTTTTPMRSAPAPTWPSLQTSLIANLGDTTAEEAVEETRTVRILETTRDNLQEEVLEMEVDGAATMEGERDENRERTAAMGRGRGRGGDNNNKRGKYRDY